MPEEFELEISAQDIFDWTERGFQEITATITEVLVEAQQAANLDREEKVVIIRISPT
jgi:hypothetical protein